MKSVKTVIVNCVVNITFYFAMLMAFLYTLNNCCVLMASLGATGEAAIGLGSVLTAIIYIAGSYTVGWASTLNTKIKSYFNKEAK